MVIHNRCIGRGPTRAQAFYRENLVVVLMEDAMTKGEQSLIADGKTDLALQVRRGVSGDDERRAR